MNKQDLLRHDMAKKEAEIRFSLIGPAISETFSDANRAAYFRRVSQIPVDWPDGSKRKFHASTLTHWYYDYLCGGYESLIRKRRADSGTSRKITAEQGEYICQKLQEFPKITGVMVYEKMKEDGLIKDNGYSIDTIQKYIRNHNLRDKSEKPVKERRTWEYEHSCDGYESDTCYTFYIYDENGEYRRTYLIAIIDNHSRMIVGAEFFFHDNALNYQKVWKSAVLRYGRSKVMILDNGSSYKNASTTEIAMRLGTTLIYNPPSTPTGKAVVERFFKTIKDRWLNCDHGSNYHSLTELNEKLTAWIAEYNRSEHSALKDDKHNMHTPIERYMYDMKDKEPCMLVNQLPEDYDAWVKECFLHETKRKVNGDSTVTVNGVLFDVPSIYIGSRVIIRYEPRDLSLVYLYDIQSRQKTQLKKTDKVENGKIRREEIIY